MPRTEPRGTARIAEPSGVRLFSRPVRVRQDNLPAEISSFIGREAAIAEVAELLKTRRLVTLSGAPGVGKTRLALRVAADLRDDFRDGVCLVELAALVEPALVPSLVASTLGLREEEGRSPTMLLQERLRAQQQLLVLDNCEHLPDACAVLVDSLLRSCPELHVLATSRRPLDLPGEVCWSVPPLTLPDQSAVVVGLATSADRPTPGRSPRNRAPRPAQHSAPAQHSVPAQQSVVDLLLASEAGRLFVDRAQAVRQTMALNDSSALAVAQICRQLDGIPLAIELAAARVGALSPGEISARLDDRFALLARGGRTALPRQRTLRESVDWSYELLTEPERALLRRLAIYRGGWSLEAAEALGSSSADVLASLVDKSLVVAEEHDGETRYTFLETIRQYALERLREAGEEDHLAHLHRAWCVAFAERASHYLRGPEQAGWRARLEVEHDNIRAAIGRTIERRDAEPGIRICIALWHFWIDRGYSHEGYEWLQRLLALDAPPQRTVIRAAGLFVAAKLAFEGGDLVAAQALGEESLAIAREVGDPHTLHRTLTQLGHIARGRGEWLAARRYYEEALPLRRELGEPVDVAVSLACLGHVARAMREYDTAESLYHESLRLAVRQGHPPEITAAQHDLGRLAQERGRYDEAAAWYAEALPVALRINHARRTAYLLEAFAALAARQQPERALTLAGAAAALRQLSGSVLPPNPQLALDRELDPARQQLGEDRQLAAWTAGQALSAEQAVALALSPALPGQAAAPALPDTLPGRLTSREAEVVGLVGRGLTNRQIAEQLVVSERTAEWHVANCLGKLGLDTRAQLAVWAARQGLSAPADPSSA